VAGVLAKGARYVPVLSGFGIFDRVLGEQGCVEAATGEWVRSYRKLPSHLIKVDQASPQTPKIHKTMR
jgi:hypothetical protein